MKRLASVALITFSLSFTLTADSAKGQSTRNIPINIPFDFFVLGERLEAGEYTFGRLNAGNPNLLLIKGGPRRRTKVVLAQRVEARDITREPVWVFTRYQGQYLLAEMWEGGNKNGQRLPERNYEKTPGEKIRERVIVRLAEQTRRN